MPYTFSTAIPQSNQKISATQAPIESNFQAVNEWININHVGFDNESDYGKHNFTSLVFQSVDPDTADSEMAIYSKATPDGNNAGEIFYRYPNNGTVIQLTNNSSSSGYTGNGYAIFNSSNYGIAWGTATGLVGNSVNNMVNMLPSITLIGPVVFTPVGPTYNPSATFFLNGLTGSYFVLLSRSSSVPSSVYWWAPTLITI